MTKPTESEKASATPASAKATQPAAPQPAPIHAWAALAVGSTILAPDKDDSGNGFYYAVVQKISADQKTLTCLWKGFPELGSFTVQRLRVGLVAMVK